MQEPAILERDKTLEKRSVASLKHTREGYSHDVTSMQYLRRVLHRTRNGVPAVRFAARVESLSDELEPLSDAAESGRLWRGQRQRPAELDAKLFYSAAYCPALGHWAHHRSGHRRRHVSCLRSLLSAGRRPGGAQRPLVWNTYDA